MKNIGYVFLFLLIGIAVSCSTKSNSEKDQILETKETISKEDSSSNVKTSGDVVLKIDESFYNHGLDSVQTPISDRKKYKLDSFSRLKGGEDQFEYYLLKHLHLIKDVDTYLIAEEYESESICWLVNYDKDGRLLDTLEVYYDNAEGAWQTSALLNIQQSKITLQIYDAYSNPDTKKEELKISEEGKFLKITK